MPDFFLVQTSCQATSRDSRKLLFLGTLEISHGVIMWPRSVVQDSPKWLGYLSEHLGTDNESQEVSAYHKPSNSIRSLLGHPKDRTPPHPLPVTRDSCGDTTLVKRLRPWTPEETEWTLEMSVCVHQNKFGQSIDWEGVRGHRPEVCRRQDQGGYSHPAPNTISEQR